MGTDKRARQKEQSRSRAEAARKEALTTARKRRFVNLGLLGAVLVVVIGVLVIVGQDDDKAGDKSSSTTTTTTAAAGATGASGATGATGSTTTTSMLSGATPCPEADGSSPEVKKFSEAPPSCIDEAKHYTAQVSTSMGDFTIQLDPTKAPKTVNNFVVLARYHYFDGLVFHRIVPDFVIQGGDPLGTGSGGPGYQIEDELPQASDYKPYSVAMANSGPNTNGSQFFVVLSEDGAKGLTAAVGGEAKYSLFGTVTEGMDVVDTIGKVEVSGDTPSTLVTMTSVTITES